MFGSFLADVNFKFRIRNIRKYLLHENALDDETLDNNADYQRPSTSGGANSANHNAAEPKVTKVDNQHHQRAVVTFQDNIHARNKEDAQYLAPEATQIQSGSFLNISNIIHLLLFFPFPVLCIYCWP